MIYLAEFDVKETWSERVDLPPNMDQAAEKLHDAVRKRGVILSRDIEVELAMAEDLSAGKALVIVGGYRPVGSVKITRVLSARNQPEGERE
jgi:hypothetical protein